MPPSSSCRPNRRFGGIAAPAFLHSWSTAAEETELHLHLNDLEGFFANPARYLLVHHLGLRMRDDPLVLEDSEPFVLQGLERYGLRLAMTVPAIAGAEAATLQAALNASGRLPHGAPGRYAFQRLLQETEHLLDRLTTLTASPLPPLPVDILLSGWSLSGRLEGRFSSGLVIFRPTTVKAGDFLQAWIRHLVYQLAGDENGERRTYLVFDDGIRCFHPLPNGRND
jgi:exodeoxyribonuclease V gamma subunit